MDSREDQQTRKQRESQAPWARCARRHLLKGLWLLFLAALSGTCAACAKILFSFLSPPKVENTSSIDAGLLRDLPQVHQPPRLFPQGQFWLIHSEKGLQALHVSCTHLDCKFNWDTQQEVFICPCHGSRFTRHGKVLNGPAARDLDQFAIHLVGNNGTLLRSSHETNQPLPPLLIDDLLTKSKGESTDTSHGEAKQSSGIHVVVDTSIKFRGKLSASQSREER